MAKVLNSNDFQNEVLNNEEVLVDFFAEWCGPCKMIAPVLDELSREMNEKTKIVKVDIDKSRDLAIQYGVMAVPTLMIFKNGKVVEKMVGFQPKDALKAKLNKYSS